MNPMDPSESFYHCNLCGYPLVGEEEHFDCTEEPAKLSIAPVVVILLLVDIVLACAIWSAWPVVREFFG